MGTTNKKVLALAIVSMVAVGGVIGGFLILGNDTSAPIVRITNPIDARVYDSAELLVTITTSDGIFGKIDSVWYCWEEGINVTASGVGTIEDTIEFAEGTITLQAWANDTAGNLGHTSITFKVDTALPSVSILSPVSGVHGSASQQLEISASDVGEGEIDSVWYSWQDGINATYTEPVEILFEEREIVLTAWANDTAGNTASASVTYIIDCNYPDITIISPLSTRYGSVSHTLEITATDNYGVDDIWYSWKGPTTGSGGTGDVNITYGGPEVIAFDTGVNIVKVWANDTHGNVAFKKLLFVVQGNNFSSVWDTTKTCGGSSASNQVKLPLWEAGRYDFIVDWGDGTNNVITAWDQAETTHTYGSSGIYTVNITGILIGWRFMSSGDHLKIVDIKHWGDLLLSSDAAHFRGCSNLKITTDDILNLAETTSLLATFMDCVSIDVIPHIDEWDTSTIVIMDNLFFNASAFSQSLNGWNTSHATSMWGMFAYASSFNQSIGNWDTSSVTIMRDMFHHALKFNQSIGNWDTSRVTTMQGMFSAANDFNQSIGNWDVSHVTNMNSMFKMVYDFNQDISGWNVSSCTDFGYMFSNADAFNQDIGEWNVSSASILAAMFESAASFNQNLSAWDVSNAINMNRMFYHATSFNQNLSSWDVSQVASMEFMFTMVILSTPNYDSLLIAWSQLSLQSNVKFDGGFSKYSVGAAATARGILTGTFGWIITDGGKE